MNLLKKLEEIIYKLNYNSDYKILNEVAFVCRNVSADSQNAFKFVKSNIPKLLIDIYRESTEKALKKEILECFLNLLRDCNSNITGELLLLPTLEIFIANIDKTTDSPILRVSIAGLYLFLLYGKVTAYKNNIIAMEVEGNGLVPIIEDLFDHTDRVICDVAKLIIQDYFKSEEI